MASEKAKALAAQQKAEKKAAKLAKKNSNDPKDWGFVKQITQTYKVTKEQNPKTGIYMLALWAGVVAVATLVGLLLLPPWWMWVILGIFGGLTADLYLLTHLAKNATYKRYEGQPGSAEVAFGMLNKKKYLYQVAVAYNKQLDLVHRVLGPGGIMLVGEGSSARLRPLLAAEVRKHEQIAYGVVVKTVIVGKGEGLVPLDKLAAYIKKQPKAVDKQQISETKARLKALDAIRPKVPIPKGPMPAAKGVGRALRGR
ncbi:MAG: DUF4191 domain-containing protein [Propionibacteriaceae bacterium]|jgi:hypothetical protein|nr:DUF4191 domain-containing protein [Propionibacteriaceae bacterium]